MRPDKTRRAILRRLLGLGAGSLLAFACHLSPLDDTPSASDSAGDGMGDADDLSIDGGSSDGVTGDAGGAGCTSGKDSGGAGGQASLGGSGQLPDACPQPQD
jgi:hypothetical protein